MFVPQEIIQIILRKRKIMMWNDKLKLNLKMNKYGYEVYGCCIIKRTWKIQYIGYFLYDKRKNKRTFHYLVDRAYIQIKY